jgi:hypothetical protein
MERLDVPSRPAGTPGPLSRPTPAAIGGLLEGGGFSKVAVEQDEVTSSSTARSTSPPTSGDRRPVRAMIEQHGGEAQEEAWDAITQAAADAGGRLEAAELLERGAARLGNRLAPASHNSGGRPRRGGRTGPPLGRRRHPRADPSASHTLWSAGQQAVERVPPMRDKRLPRHRRRPDHGISLCTSQVVGGPHTGVAPARSIAGRSVPSMNSLA